MKNHEKVISIIDSQNICTFVQFLFVIFKLCYNVLKLIFILKNMSKSNKLTTLHAIRKNKTLKQ